MAVTARKMRWRGEGMLEWDWRGWEIGRWLICLCGLSCGKERWAGACHLELGDGLKQTFVMKISREDVIEMREEGGKILSFWRKG